MAAFIFPAAMRTAIVHAIEAQDTTKHAWAKLAQFAGVVDDKDSAYVAITALVARRYKALVNEAGKLTKGETDAQRTAFEAARKMRFRVMGVLFPTERVAHKTDPVEQIVKRVEKLSTAQKRRLLKLLTAAQ